MAEFLSSDPKIQDSQKHTTYDLIANISHDGEPGLCCLYNHSSWNLNINSKLVDILTRYTFSLKNQKTSSLFWNVKTNIPSL